MKAKLKFLEFVSNKLNKFLRGYETDQPMVLKLMKVDANDVNLHKPYDLIQISSMLSITRKATDFTESTLLRFYKEVSMLLASLTSHFMERSYLKHLIVCCLSCPVSTQLFSMTQRNMQSQRNNCMPLVVLSQEMLEELVPKYREEFANFDILTNRLDNFIIPPLSAKKLYIPSKVYILIF